MSESQKNEERNEEETNIGKIFVNELGKAMAVKAAQITVMAGTAFAIHQFQKRRARRNQEAEIDRKFEEIIKNY